MRAWGRGDGRRIAAAVALAGALAAGGCGGSSDVSADGSDGAAVDPGATAPAPPPGPTPTVTIGAWTGRGPVMVFLSADAGNVVTDLEWPVWEHDHAVGHGVRNVLDCEPSCAEGASVPYPVTITLSHPVDGRFTVMLEETADPERTVETFEAPYLGQGACPTSDPDSCAFGTEATTSTQPSVPEV